MENTVKSMAEGIVNKRVDWLRKRGQRAMELDTPIFLNKTTAMVGTSLEGENHYYKVSIKPGHEECGCKDWKYRGKVNGIPCKHMIRAMAERMVRDEARAQERETQEILAEADAAIARGELVSHIQ